jgi:transcriptional regulator with XRE-family HTH domain
MTPAARFGRRVRDIRKTHRMKIGQVADQTGAGVKHLGRIERGEKQPSFELIFELADAMNVSPARFFEFDASTADTRLLRKQLDQLLAGRDSKQLQQIRRVLVALFDV